MARHLRLRDWKMSTVRFFFMLINFLTLMSGVSLLAIAIFGMSSQARTTSIYSTGVPLGIFILSLYLLTISIMGFYGTRKERINTLRVYMALVVIAFVVQLALGAVALGRVADMESAMFDAWQEVFSCCGFSSLIDRAVPSDCSISEEFGFLVPCKDKVIAAGNRSLQVTGVSLISIGIIEAAAVFVSLLLYWNWPDEEEGYGSDEATRRLVNPEHLSAHVISKA
ncbi:hypothetical protein DI09_41p180 [Mitosporidium daphniae]|uniref:Tetraspanin n=1 Tax=Mitosporidium daphniae TaxID=1485682 RepID=A0A098VU15_9MICR|nr:uncharacterized protein DI09_41p180 [Mitosporidium daphniae]KGG51206.1 hypothetical protein DI09_41p180 [Mitosporidium daphniae]|eukprot:XP_013237633.1 uncharacterized protein DI09_41p180 [Mitosporidium daphniae]